MIQSMTRWEAELTVSGLGIRQVVLGAGTLHAAAVGSVQFLLLFPPQMLQTKQAEIPTLPFKVGLLQVVVRLVTTKLVIFFLPSVS